MIRNICANQIHVYLILWGKKILYIYHNEKISKFCVTVFLYRYIYFLDYYRQFR